jgi:prevent-host-death family protein
MLTVKENATIVGVAEVRKGMKEVLEEMKTRRVILTRRNKPVGVLIDYEEFRRMEEVLEALEDNAFGRIAARRAKRKDRKLVTLEEAEEKVESKWPTRS